MQDASNNQLAPQIAEGHYGNNTNPAPEFGNFTTTRAIFNIPRSSAYALEAMGEIKFCRLRKRGNQRGRVLVDLDSVREYLKRCASQEVSK